MKVGSIVVVLRGHVVPKRNQLITWLPLMDEKTLYTIRDIITDRETGGKNPGVRFEEGVMGYLITNGKELTLDIVMVKEVLPPDDIEEITQMVDDCQAVEVL